MVDALAYWELHYYVYYDANMTGRGYPITTQYLKKHSGGKGNR